MDGNNIAETTFSYFLKSLNEYDNYIGRYLMLNTHSPLFACHIFEDIPSMTF